MPNIDEVSQQYAANRPVSMWLFKQAQESLAGGVGQPQVGRGWERVR